MTARSLLVLVLVLLAWPVSAQDDARALFRRGVAALREGRHADAERAFLASYRAEPRTATLCNLALTYDEWQRRPEAADHYERCAATDEEGRFRAHALERAQALREELAREAAAAAVAPEVDEDATATPPSPFAASPPTAEATEVPIVEHGASPAVEGRSHTLAIVGSAVAALGVGLAATGVVFAARSRDARESLDERHPGDGPVTLPAGSEDAALLSEARRDRRVALAAYASGAVLGALGATLVVLDLVQPDAPAVAAAPLPGGAMVVARLRVGRAR